jgi:hypothetical protein
MCQTIYLLNRGKMGQEDDVALVLESELELGLTEEDSLVEPSRFHHRDR